MIIGLVLNIQIPFFFVSVTTMWNPLLNAIILAILAFLIIPSRIIRVATAIYGATAVGFSVFVFLVNREIFSPSEKFVSAVVFVLFISTILLFWAYVLGYSRVSYPTILKVNAFLNTVGLLFWGINTFSVDDQYYAFLYFFAMSAYTIAFLIFYVALLVSRRYLREFDRGVCREET